MTTIYLIRHAEAEGNLYRIARGQYNSLLTDRGARQVAALLKNGHGECVRQAAPQVDKQAVRQLSEVDRTAAGIQMTSEDVFFWEPAVVKMPEVAP